MIPDHVDIGSVWCVLPPGIHVASLGELEDSFSYNPDRTLQYRGLVEALRILAYAGCKRAYVDGSYVTEKSLPGDFDACWDPVGVDPSKLDPVLLDFSDKRKNQKKRFGGELFPSTAPADGTSIFLDFFQIDRHTGKPKGIICIKLDQEFRDGAA